MTYSEFLKGRKLKKSLTAVASTSAVPGMVKISTVFFSLSVQSVYT